jgi:hypothetical protein
VQARDIDRYFVTVTTACIMKSSRHNHRDLCAGGPESDTWTRYADQWWAAQVLLIQLEFIYGVFRSIPFASLFTFLSKWSNGLEYEDVVLQGRPNNRVCCAWLVAAACLQAGKFPCCIECCSDTIVGNTCTMKYTYLSLTMVGQALFVITQAFKVGVVGGAAYLVLGKPMRTIKIILKIFDIATRLAMIAGFLAVGYNS